MYLFIDLHLTAQSGPVTLLVIICHSYCSSQGGIDDVLRRPLIRREKGDVCALLRLFVVYLTLLTDPLRMPPWSQDRRNQTKSEKFNDCGGRGYDDFVPVEVTNTAPSGDETT